MPKQRSTAVLWGLLFVSGLLNIVLGVRVFPLGHVSKPVPAIKVGAPLEDVVGLTAKGQPITIRFGDTQGPTVLFVLRPGCHWCDLNMPNWQVLKRARKDKYRFVAVSLSSAGLDEYMNLSNLDLPAVFPLPGRNPTLNRISGPPQTIVVGTDGIVQKVWFGAYTVDIKHEVEAYFGLNLPVEVKTSG